jgi:hypothetical protein
VSELTSSTSLPSFPFQPTVETVFTDPLVKDIFLDFFFNVKEAFGMPLTVFCLKSGPLRFHESFHSVLKSIFTQIVSHILEISVQPIP